MAATDAMSPIVVEGRRQLTEGRQVYEGYF
jgi:hypothetical protein